MIYKRSGEYRLQKSIQAKIRITNLFINEKSNFRLLNIYTISNILIKIS